VAAPQRSWRSTWGGRGSPPSSCCARRRRRWAIANGAPQGDHKAVACRRHAEYGARGRHRALPRLGDAACPSGQEVIYWYFTEVPKLTDEVGVAEAEKLAAAGAH